jgi:hypothetical protein
MSASAIYRKGGCYLDTIAEVMVGETLFLRILMADGEWFDLRSVVAHYTPTLVSESAL